MKLVVDGEIYQRQSVGGISRIYNAVLPRMCEQDEDLRVLVLTEGCLRQAPPPHPHIVHRHMPAYEHWLRPGRLWAPAVRRLKLTTRRSWTHPDHDATWQATYYSLPRQWDGRFVVMFHDLIEELFPQLFHQPHHEVLRQQKRSCALTADIVICNSRTTQQDLCAFYGIAETKTRLVTLAADDNFRQLAPAELAVEQVNPLLPASPFLLYVGDRSAYKNFEFLLRNYSAWEHRQQVALVLVGARLTAKEQALIAELGLTDRVLVYEQVNDATLCKLYNLALAFVYPSLYEGFGIPLIEAMLCGCPIVASRIATSLDVAGDLPIYFDPTDAADLLRALSAAVETGARLSGERDRQVVERGLAHAAQFTWDATAAQFLAIHRELAGSVSRLPVKA